MRRVARAFEGIHLDAVHCFRLYTVPLAEPYLATSRLLRYLDLDDIESTVRRRLAQRYRTYGYEDEAQDEEEEARRYELVERQLLPQFDRIYVCSQQDKEELGWRYGCRNLCVVPNALHAADPFPPKAPTTPFTLLFVGTLNYFPNVDALAFLCDDVLPMLRRKTHRPFVVSVIGGGAADVSVRFAHVPEVRMIGRVSDLAPWYQRADVAVVPIQTGGGTRIKVVEAFKYGRPVVSTSVGIEGLEVNHGEHVLVGDTAGAFAECCLRLMADSALAELLARNASLLFRRAYTTEAATSFLASCFTSEAQMAGVTPATGLIRPTNRVKS